MPHPSGLWATAGGRTGRGSPVPQGRVGVAPPRRLMEDRDLGHLRKAASCCCTPQGAPGQSHPPCFVRSPPVRGSRPLLLQRCCAQLFGRRLGFLPVASNGAIPPHPRPSRTPVPEPRVQRGGPSTVLGVSVRTRPCHMSTVGSSRLGLAPEGAAGPFSLSEDSGPQQPQARGRPSVLAQSGGWEGCSWGPQVSSSGPHSPGRGWGQGGGFPGWKGKESESP